MPDNLIRAKKRRFFLLDIIRVVCAFLIYARHSITMFGCTYGHFCDVLFTSLTSPVMTCFFILSGFSIHYQHREDELNETWTRNYLKKRLISIMPCYLLVVLLWPLVYPEQIRDWLVLLPVDLIGIQTFYRSLFGILHNGGTWFVSCLLFAYLIYPIIKAVLRGANRWVSVIGLMGIHFLLMYSVAVISIFSLDSLYSNPIARAAEFSLGVIFSDILFMKMTVLLPSGISVKKAHIGA